ncbi:MAG: hypothetical protein VX246_04955 [Myxococcota bacterium]|nr:hypothetical protein [Myxococcota bacterium]
MLTRLDDYPVHQTSFPLAVPHTTDRNAYDRYWFNGYDKDAEFYIGIGAAVYPNLNIMDAGISLVIDGEQHAFHASRRKPDEPSIIDVGPFRIDILEPMKSLRVTVDDNETGFSGELLWIPRTSNFAEGHQHSIRPGGTTMEATRFNQFGYWAGELRYDGRTLKVNPETTYGTKDRSWGVRPVGDADPGGAPNTLMPQVFFLWAPLHWENRCTHAGLFENEHGIMWHWDGMVMPTYEDPESIPLVTDPGMKPLLKVDHDLTYIPGTRRASHAVITKTELDGTENHIELESKLVFRMKGIGYSHPEWGHGKWKGELAVGGEKWKLADADEMAWDNQHIQQVVSAKCGDETGVGVLEQIAFGPHPKYGFKELLDPAQ